ncbi:MAG: glycoside hydrolase family 3 C-terminal domain-containing protein [Thermoanaerobaculia bacterium]|nr:glycoside hydrolase family 3 C-terminal domain-containing protein [Thermoanaerobaculia bacterium]
MLWFLGQSFASAQSPCGGTVGIEAFESCISDLVARMTLEEKAGFLSGADLWTTKPIDRMAIPSIRLADGSHGLLVEFGGKQLQDPATTAFPTSSALAATWSPELLRRIGGALGREARERGVDVILGPGLNLQRSPLGGRNFQRFSEDPVLAGELAAALIQGIQSTGVAATVKHFVAGHQETGRFVMNVDVDPRTLRELYLRAFEIAVTEGDPKLVMSAHHRVNGVPISRHAGLLRGVLRNSWGFGGVVVSDWLAVDDAPAAHAAGLDLRMPGVGRAIDAQVVAAVRGGRLDETVIDASVRRLLRLVLTQASARSVESSQADIDSHHRLAREAATQSIVLLRNAGDLLPLDASIQRVAVIGAWAKTPRIRGAARRELDPALVDVPFDEIVRSWREGRDPAEAGGFRVDFAPAYDAATGMLLDAEGEQPAGMDDAVRKAAAAEVALVFVGTPPGAESEGRDRADLGLAAGHDQLISAVAGVQDRVVVVLQNGGAVAMPWLVEVEAVVETWLGGQGMGAALADVLFGHASPGGRLPMTFPGRLEQTATYPLFPSGERRIIYGEGLFVGYRHFDVHAQTPLFPFGHGLGYGQIEYSDLDISGELTPARSLTVAFTLTNRGLRRASEVAQLYVSPRGGRLSRPEQVLADFGRVELEAGESERLTLEVEPRDVTVWDEARGRWILDASRVEVRVGTSSREIRLRTTVEFVAPAPPPAFDRYTLLAEWLTDPRGEAMMGPLIEGLVAATFPGPEAEEDRRRLREYLLTLPGIKVVQLSRGALDLGKLDAMIRQVNGS